MVRYQLLALLSNEDSLFTFIMTSSNITASSTKAQIIEASEELIGDLDEKLTKAVRLTSSLKEERTTLAYLVVFTSTIALLF